MRAGIEATGLHVLWQEAEDDRLNVLRTRQGYGGGPSLVSNGGVADMCILGEPTEQKVVLGHYGALWVRISTQGPFVHTAFAEGRLAESSSVRMQDVLSAVREWIPHWEERTAYGGRRGIVGI